MTHLHSLFGRDRAGGARTPVEGELPSLAGATTWLNAEPLTPEGLRGRVVLVNFCTYTCINWIRSLPWVRAWADRYGDRGLTVIGVHTPEFSFEHDLDNIRGALRAMDVRYPVAVDNDYRVWRAFDNNYWPALYFVDAQGRIRHHWFGEGAYEESERVLQRLLGEAGAEGVEGALVELEPTGIELGADWDELGSAENYLGYERTEGFASPGGAVPDERHTYTAPASLRRNQWALSGDWRMGPEAASLEAPGGVLSCRFHARDVNLILGPSRTQTKVPFRVRIDGQPPGPARGLDVDDEGNGTVTEQRVYQLLRQPTPIVERLFEVEFVDAGAQAFDFTFG
jgi:hypothetical protein